MHTIARRLHEDTYGIHISSVCVVGDILVPFLIERARERGGEGERGREREGEREREREGRERRGDQKYSTTPAYILKHALKSML